MGILLKFLAGPLGSYALIGVILVTTASLTYGYAQHQSAVRYRIERNTAVSENGRLIATVKSKDSVIDTLTTALEQWQVMATESARESTEAGQRAEAYESELNAARIKLRSLTEGDRARPDCQNLMSTDFTAACPGAAASLHEWARRHLQRAGGEGPNTGGSTH